MRRIIRSSLVAAGAIALGVVVVGAASGDDAPAKTGSVRGAVRFKGTAPKRAKLEVTKDKAVCAAKALYDESLIVGGGKGGGLANAVVSIEGLKAAAPTTAAKVVQVGCRYVPHVQAVGVGSEILLLNSDKTLHNVHGFLDEDTVWNVALSNVGTKSKQKIEDPGVVVLKCDAGHTWMRAYVVAFEHPYFAVTGPDGSFAIDGVPAGKHSVRVWHETLGTTTGTVEVTVGGTASLELTMGKK